MFLSLIALTPRPLVNGWGGEGGGRGGGGKQTNWFFNSLHEDEDGTVFALYLYKFIYGKNYAIIS
jgi:hypothetical protein